MKAAVFTLALVCVICACASARSVSELKEKVLQAGDNTHTTQAVFNLVTSSKPEGNNEFGAITISVAKKAHQVELSEKEQRSGFIAMGPTQTSLASQGFNYWRPTPNGFNFMQKAPIAVSDNSKVPGTGTQDEVIVCKAAGAKDAGKAIDLSFSCEQTLDSMRFTTVKAENKAEAKGWTWVDDPQYYGSYYNPSMTGWVTCPDYNGAYAPYGYQSSWPTWPYAYYIISPYGYYGCNVIDASSGMCTDGIYLYGAQDYVYAGF